MGKVERIIASYSIENNIKKMPSFTLVNVFCSTTQGRHFVSEAI